MWKTKQWFTFKFGHYRRWIVVDFVLQKEEENETECSRRLIFVIVCRAQNNIYFIGTLVKCLILRWSLSISQWQLYSTVICFWPDPLHSSRVCLWMSDCSFAQHHFWIATEVIKALFGCCMAGAMWNLPSWHTFCGCQTTMHHFIVSLYSMPQTLDACWNLPPAILVEWLVTFIFDCGKKTGIFYVWLW